MYKITVIILGSVDITGHCDYQYIHSVKRGGNVDSKYCNCLWLSNHTKLLVVSPGYNHLTLIQLPQTHPTVEAITVLITATCNSR